MGCAALIASELRIDAGVRLRGRLETLALDETERTTANHVREVVKILLDCYADEPATDTVTH